MTVDGFRLVRQLPGGRHGGVWQAIDTTDGAAVALKQMLGVDANSIQRLRAEVDRLTELSDRHLVPSRPPVGDREAYWLVEEWIEGVSLAAVIDGSTEPLTRPQALGIVRGALLGLSAAHRHGLAHGELSPRSVMIDASGQPVLVGFAAHLADATVAASDGFAAPEAHTETPAAPRADVYAVGRILERLLASEAVPADLQTVVARATASDPTSRHPDAGSLLADLEETAERAYGAGWWTTAGLSGLAASATGITAVGTVGAAATGSGGAVTGALSAGSGALAGASHTAGGGAVAAARSGISAATRTGLVIAGTAVVLVALVVGAAAILRPDTADRVSADTAAAGPSRAGAPVSQAAPPPKPTATTTPRPTPTPTPTPNPTLDFTGTYRYDQVVTKSNDARSPVGKRYRTTWTVSTTCRGSTCTSEVRAPGEDAFTLNTSGGRWKTVVTYPVECRDSKTGKSTGQKVKVRYSRTLAPKALKGGALSITGSSRYQQLKKCTNQSIPQQDVRSKISITRTT